MTPIGPHTHTRTHGLGGCLGAWVLGSLGLETRRGQGHGDTGTFSTCHRSFTNI